MDRLLVVEGDSSLQEAYTERLRTGGLYVERAVTKHQLVDSLCNVHEFTVVVAGGNTPDDAVELVKKVKAQGCTGSIVAVVDDLATYSHPAFVAGATHVTNHRNAPYVLEDILYNDAA